MHFWIQFQSSSKLSLRECITKEKSYEDEKQQNLWVLNQLHLRNRFNNPMQIVWTMTTKGREKRIASCVS